MGGHAGAGRRRLAHERPARRGALVARISTLSLSPPLLSHYAELLCVDFDRRAFVWCVLLCRLFAPARRLCAETDQRVKRERHHLPSTR